MPNVGRDDGEGDPDEPFEEVVGMPRAAPQADVADLAATGGVGSEPPQLRVGRRLADERDREDREAENILQAET